MEDKEKDQRAVFTGSVLSHFRESEEVTRLTHADTVRDTLFVSGCGRFFEGEPQEMHVALNEKLAALPSDTVTYVGHEYTASNVAFSKKIEPENEAISKLERYCKENEVTTGKFTIGDEKAHNVFMRTDQPAVQSESVAQTLVWSFTDLR